MCVRGMGRRDGQIIPLTFIPLTLSDPVPFLPSSLASTGLLMFKFRVPCVLELDADFTRMLVLNADRKTTADY
jgi:hypothetical protein